jgi:hypothetical protein
LFIDGVGERSDAERGGEFSPSIQEEEEVVVWGPPPRMPPSHSLPFPARRAPLSAVLRNLDDELVHALKATTWPVCLPQPLGSSSSSPSSHETASTAAAVSAFRSTTLSWTAAVVVPALSLSSASSQHLLRASTACDSQLPKPPHTTAVFFIKTMRVAVRIVQRATVQQVDEGHQDDGLVLHLQDD